MSGEWELIARAQTGDEAAFEELVVTNQNRIYNLTLRMSGNPDDAQELAQEAFLSAWRGLPRFQGNSSFSTWLYRLATNVCIDYLRRQKRRGGQGGGVSLDDDEDRAVLQLPDRGPGPEEELERRETREAIGLGLSRLSEEHRRILVMREMDGLSYTEIGDLLQLEEGTVKSRIARARLALRSVLIEGNFFASRPSKVTERRKGGGEHVPL